MTQQIMSLKPVLKESLHRKIADAIIDYINTSGLKQAKSFLLREHCQKACLSAETHCERHFVYWKMKGL